jgi:DNA-binding GntR family transcriptional regulator
MGTSRGPVPEAIRMLTGLGLVTAVLNRGVFVRQMSVREMLELYDLRAQAAYDDIIKEMHLFRREYFNAPGNMRQSNAEHRTLYEAIVKGSKAKAKAKSTAVRHVLKGRERLLSNIDNARPMSRL